VKDSFPFVYVLPSACVRADISVESDICWSVRKIAEVDKQYCSRIYLVKPEGKLRVFFPESRSTAESIRAGGSRAEMANCKGYKVRIVQCNY
jgi:hypothetical protein